MTQPPPSTSPNPHPLSTLRVRLVWEGRYDEYGQRQAVDIAGCTLPIQTVYQRLNITPQQLRDFCQRWQISEFALFGSILQENFRIDGEQPSDVDVLFTYGKNSRKNLILQARMKFELEDLVRRNVDLMSKTAIESDPNYIRRQNILNSARIIYVER